MQGGKKQLNAKESASANKIHAWRVIKHQAALLFFSNFFFFTNLMTWESSRGNSWQLNQRNLLCRLLAPESGYV